GSNVEKLGARDAEQEDRSIAREVGDMLDEVDEDGFRPLEIVDHDDPWTNRCSFFEKSSEGELRLGRRRADHGGRLNAKRDEHLDERQVRDALAVREAAATQDVSGIADPLEEVRDEPRLADSGRPEQGEEPARPVFDRVLVVAPEPPALSLAADERGFGVPRESV